MFPSSNPTFKSHIVQYVTKSWGGYVLQCKKKKKEVSTQQTKYYGTAYVAVLKQTMYGVVQRPFRVHCTLTVWSSHSIQSPISRPPLICSMESVHMILIMRDPWYEANPTIY